MSLSAIRLEPYIVLDNWATLCRSYKTRGGTFATFTVLVDGGSANRLYVYSSRPKPSVLTIATVSEVIALKLRLRKEREYLYPQIFCELSYIYASFCMWLLRRLKRRKRHVHDPVESSQSAVHTST